MKTRILIKRVSTAVPLPAVSLKGDWIDLRARQRTEVGVRGPITHIPLNVCVQLPEGYEALVVPRSSTPAAARVWMANGVGVIDNSYCGDWDEWQFPAVTIGCASCVVEEGQRIAQFRVQLSQKATLWQRIRHLLSSGVEIVEVDSLAGANRGGFGTTGKH